MDGGPTATAADTGGHLLAEPVTHRLLPIAPAERYDLIIDFKGVPIGGRVRLLNRLGSGRARDVMAFLIARTAADDDRRIPRTLSNDLPAWRRSDAARVRDFSFRTGRMRGDHGWLIGGLPFDACSRPAVATEAAWAVGSLIDLHGRRLGDPTQRPPPDCLLRGRPVRRAATGCRLAGCDHRPDRPSFVRA